MSYYEERQHIEEILISCLDSGSLYHNCNRFRLYRMAELNTLIHELENNLN